MKLTQSMLRTIIKEELKKALKESDGYSGYEIFRREPPTGTTNLSNDEYAVLAVIGELMSDGSDITKSAIERYYRTVAGRSNGMVDSKKFLESLKSLMSKKLVERDEWGINATEAGDNELRNAHNHPVNKFLFAPLPKR